MLRRNEPSVSISIAPGEADPRFRYKRRRPTSCGGTLLQIVEVNTQVYPEKKQKKIKRFSNTTYSVNAEPE